MKSIPQVIQELRAMPAAELAARYEELFGRPPRTKNRQHLWRRCAWKEQERRLGGLSGAAKKRLDELASDLDLPLGARRGQGGPVVGATLVREWRGREVRVRVLESGFEHEGVTYRSLSAVAKAVTGAHWNGRLFFGLRTRSTR